ncbi:hypothetical protein ABK040_015230 [Willaertia magna]
MNNIKLKETLLATLFISLAFLLHFSHQSYIVKSASATVNVLSNSDCYLSVTETFVFSFTGSYSTLGRPIPTANTFGYVNIKTSSLDVSISNPGYSVYSKNIVSADDGSAKFIMVGFTSTPSAGTTDITMTFNYQVQGPLGKDTNSGKDIIYWYYQFNTNIQTASVVFTFDSSLGLTSSDFSPSNGGVVTDNKVTFTTQNIAPNTPYKPIINFRAISVFDKCYSSPGLGLAAIIAIVVVLVVVCTIISIISSVVGFWRRRLFPWWYPAPAYGGFNTSPHYYGSTHHHHHHSHSGGGHHSSGITGASGFAN